MRLIQATVNCVSHEDKIQIAPGLTADSKYSHISYLRPKHRVTSEGYISKIDTFKSNAMLDFVTRVYQPTNTTRKNLQKIPGFIARTIRLC